MKLRTHEEIVAAYQEPMMFASLFKEHELLNERASSIGLNPTEEVWLKAFEEVIEQKIGL